MDDLAECETGSGSNLPQISQRHLWEQIAEQLREDIFRGVRPPGTRLVSADLAAEWGVSRGPVREALMALENEGLVVSSRRHGSIVGTPSALDLGEILAVRGCIELAAGLHVCSQGDASTLVRASKAPKLLERLKRAWELDDRLKASRLDFEFHQALVDLAGNSRFSSIYQQMVSQNTHSLRGVDPSGWPLVGWEELKASHEALLETLAEGDPEAYRAAVERHYRNARRRMSVL